MHDVVINQEIADSKDTYFTTLTLTGHANWDIFKLGYTK